MTILSIESTRVLKGCILGLPKCTVIFTLRVGDIKGQVIQMARESLIQRLPDSIHEKEHLPTSPSQRAAALFAELVLGLQLEAGIAVSTEYRVWDSSKKVNAATPSQGVNVAMTVEYAHLTQRASDWAIDFLNAVFANASYPVHSSITAFLSDFSAPPGIGINRAFIIKAADDLQIPRFDLYEDLLVLGTGSKSRWLKSLTSDKTSATSIFFAKNKQLTAPLLRLAGLPGASNELVPNATAAIKVAHKMGYPVVVKPADADRGLGVAADLRSPDEVIDAFHQASKISSKVLVEKWFSGSTHRLTVQDGQVIRVVKRVAGGVVGDGLSSIEQLVQRFQQTPMQARMTRRLGQPALALDDEALSLLSREGLNPLTIPKVGEYVRLRRRDNVNAGATNVELTPHDNASVHPDNTRLAIDAASVLRLDFAGIDLIISDISRSWLEVGALICEVNAEPQMGAWKNPLLYRHVLERLFGGASSVTASLKLVGSSEARQAQLRESILHSHPSATVSTSQGNWVHGSLVSTRFQNSFEAARALLLRRDVEQATCLITIRDLHDHGLPIGHWDSVEMDDSSSLTREDADLLSIVSSWPTLKQK